MRLEPLEGRPLTEEEKRYRLAWERDRGTLWREPMTFSAYYQYQEEDRIPRTEERDLYREKAKEGSFYTAGSVLEDTNVDVVLHPRYSYPVLHNHDYVEVIYIAEGECTHFVEKTSFGMHAGDVCMLAPSARHALCCTNDESCIVNLLMNRQFFDRHFLEILQGGKLLSGFLENILYQQQAAPYLLYPTGHDPWLRTLAQRLISEKTGAPYAGSYSIRLLSSAFLLHMVREYEMSAIVPSQKNDTQNDLIVAVLGYLAVHYSHTSLSDCASFFGYSPSYLSRMIHENTGKTFNALILELQMERAAALLRDSEMSITEIAQEVGCFDSSHFGKKFRTYFGSSPGKYKERHPS